MKNHVFWIAIILFASFSNTAFCQLVQNLTIGNAKALALGNAVTADPPGVDSIHFNPAGLALLNKRQYHIKFLAAPYASLKTEIHRTQWLEDKLAEYDLEETIPADVSEDIDGLMAYVPFRGKRNVPVVLGALGGASYSPPGSRFTFANAAYAPLVGGVKRKDNSAFGYQVKEGGVIDLVYFAPSVGVKVTDEFMVGGSLLFHYTGAGVETDLRAPSKTVHFLSELQGGIPAELCSAAAEEGDAPPFLDLCGGAFGTFDNLATIELDADDPFTLSYNIGVLWQPTPWFSWGAVYQSPVNARLKGTYTATYAPELYDFAQGIINNSSGIDGNGLGTPLTSFETGEAKGKTEIDFPIPQHFSTGVSVWVFDNWKVNFDVKWTDAGVWQDFSATLDEGFDIAPIEILAVGDHLLSESLTFPRGYKSAWNWGIGIEYQYNDALSFRFGYEPRKGAIPDDKRDILLPLSDIELYGFGFSFNREDKSVFELTVGYLVSDQDIPSGTSTNFNSYGAIEDIGRGEDSYVLYKPYPGYDAKTKIRALVIASSIRGYF